MEHERSSAYSEQSEVDAQKEIEMLDSMKDQDIKEDVWYNAEMIKDASEGVKSKLILIVGIICIFILIEAFGALISNSIAIFTDVIHLFSDLLGFVFSLISVILAKRKASKSHSYGYVRAEILGALCSVIIIWGMTIWIASKAYFRLVKIINHEDIYF